MSKAIQRPSAGACWLHPDLQREIDALKDGATTFVKHYERADHTFDVSFQRLSNDAFRRVTEFLRERREAVLMRRSVREIVDILDQAAAKWLDPSYPRRHKAVEQISIITGFSPEMVAHSIEEEQSSSRGPHLLQALHDELGDPAFLDRFTFNPRLGGFSRAIGPGLVGAIFSSNIPALPHLEVMRSFLVKSSCLGRVSAGEPVFLSLYAESLMEIDPEIASCLAVVYWERDDQERESLFLDAIDYLVVYGGDEPITKLMRAKPPTLEATWHGHGIGFCYVMKDALTRDRLDDLADRVAYDYTIFDGFACLCPQACLVETGGEVSLIEFAGACAEAMNRWAVKLPPRNLTLSEASRKHKLREISLMREANREDIHVVAAPDDLSFIVLVERLEQFEPSPGDRFLRIIPTEDSDDLERLIRPLRSYLQNAAVATADYTSTGYLEVREKLAFWGVNRVVPPGIMGRPSMMWHHDGGACLGKMVRWCDNELASPDVLLTANAEDLIRGKLL